MMKHTKFFYIKSRIYATMKEGGKRMDNKKDDWMEEVDKKIIHYVWTICISAITAFVVVYLKTH